MAYRLRDDLAFCRVDDGLVFLDIQNDQYFRLPDVVERAFSAFLDEREVATPGFQALVQERILVECSENQSMPLAIAIQAPTRSAMERSHPAPTFDVSTVLEVTAIVLSAKRRIRPRRLKAVLEALIDYRHSRSHGPTSGVSKSTEHALLRAFDQFSYARRYAPVEPSCLLDSVSLVRFLARRRLHANIVFGVTPEPLAAHCWVQAGSLVLNETVSDVAGYTPIRIV